MSELLPCPFCGSTNIQRADNGPTDQGGYGAYWTICDDCGACTGECGVKSQSEADARWNTRTPPPDSGQSDTDLNACTREQLIELVRECQRSLVLANEQLMDAGSGQSEPVANKAMPKEFGDWFAENYPKDTLIHDPEWHAPKIYWRAMYFAAHPSLAAGYVPLSDNEIQAIWDRDPVGQFRLAFASAIERAVLQRIGGGKP